MKSTHDSTTPVDKQHYKKKYLLRVAEDHEAEEEIRIAKRKRTTPEHPEVPEVQRMDQTQVYKQ
jgi:hypothetical protein